MSKLFRSEMKKLAHNLSFFLAVLLVVSIMTISIVAINEVERLEGQIYYMSFAFLAASVLVVGGIVSTEYDRHTIKELLLAGCDRPKVYFVKLSATLTATVFLFVVYAVFLVASCHFEIERIGWNLPVNQFIALMQHTFILFNLSFVLRSFSALGVSSIVFLLIYRELSMIDCTSPIGFLLNQTFITQFTSVANIFNALIACVVTACMSCAIGFLIFRAQNVS